MKHYGAKHVWKQFLEDVNSSEILKVGKAGHNLTLGIGEMVVLRELESAHAIDCTENEMCKKILKTRLAKRQTSRSLFLKRSEREAFDMYVKKWNEHGQRKQQQLEKQKQAPMTSVPYQFSVAASEPIPYSVALPLRPGQRVAIAIDPSDTRYQGTVIDAMWEHGKRPGEIICAFNVEYDNGHRRWHWVGLEEVWVLP